MRLVRSFVQRQSINATDRQTAAIPRDARRAPSSAGGVAELELSYKGDGQMGRHANLRGHGKGLRHKGGFGRGARRGREGAAPLLTAPPH